MVSLRRLTYKVVFYSNTSTVVIYILYIYYHLYILLYARAPTQQDSTSMDDVKGDGAGRSAPATQEQTKKQVTPVPEHPLSWRGVCGIIYLVNTLFGVHDLYH